MKRKKEAREGERYNCGDWKRIKRLKEGKKLRDTSQRAKQEPWRDYRFSTKKIITRKNTTRARDKRKTNS